jgi:formylglycine-generating enzyme required for sulfatase activity
VGAYPQGASPYGLLDMAGNVWEWTRSQWKRGYPYDPDDGREDMDASGAWALRGGAFYLEGEGVRSAFRFWNLPDLSLRYVGFRVCVVAEQK